MEILKIQAEGFTASFRYPHFMQEVQPTFPMPPPATIYGHICSALGRWFDPKGVRFAFHFSFSGQFDDVEHTHILTPSTGKLKGTKHSKVMEGAISPFKRQQLFRPRLVLYLNRTDWIDAFRSPKYAVVLGRSQDLFNYTNIEIVNLKRANQAYFENTLAPYDFAKRTARGITILMPRYIDYASLRAPSFQRYMVLNRRVLSEELTKYEGESDSTFTVDPRSPDVNGLKLGLLFHDWVDDGPS